MNGYFEPALSLALLVYVDALANAEMLAKKTDPPLRPLREFFALGATALGAALFGGFVPGCSSSRSIVGLRSGQRTKLAGGVAAVLLLLTSLSVVQFISPMPLAALAGVVFVAAFDLVDVRRFREFWTLRRADFWIALAAGAMVVGLGPVWGAGLGVALALAETFRRGMSPHRWMVSADAPTGRLYRLFDPQSLVVTDGVVIYRFGTPLFFGNAETLLEDMRAIVRRGDPDLRTVILNSDALGVPDATARDALLRSQELLHEHGIALVFGNVRRDLREALTTIGRFTIMEEAEFVDVFKKVRRQNEP